MSETFIDKTRSAATTEWRGDSGFHPAIYIMVGTGLVLLGMAATVIPSLGLRLASAVVGTISMLVLMFIAWRED